jgi:hypothetical protein
MFSLSSRSNFIRLPPSSLPPIFKGVRSYASPSISPDQDHYANLGVSTSATRKQIKDKFYEVNHTYTPSRFSLFHFDL